MILLNKSSGGGLRRRLNRPDRYLSCLHLCGKTCKRNTLQELVSNWREGSEINHRQAGLRKDRRETTKKDTQRRMTDNGTMQFAITEKHKRFGSSVFSRGDGSQKRRTDSAVFIVLFERCAREGVVFCWLMSATKSATRCTMYSRRETEWVLLLLCKFLVFCLVSTHANGVTPVCVGFHCLSTEDCLCPASAERAGIWIHTPG